MGKIEPQAVGSHEGTGLVHVFAEGVPQGAMQKVGSRMMPGNVLPAFLVYGGLDFLAGMDAAFPDFNKMQDLCTGSRQGVFYQGHSSSSCSDKARISYLSTPLGIKGAPVQDQVQLLFV